ncbi:MAG: 6-phosphogluconolactonase [Bradymonadaceae bacterium]
MLQQFPNAQALARAAFDLIVDRATTAVDQRDRFTLALSGGPAPKPLFDEFATDRSREQMPWHATHLFWCDERCVTLDDERSNAGMAYDRFIDEVPVPDDHAHHVDGRLAPEEAAADYRDQLTDFFGDELPRFDVAQLGLGTNGHTASLFPEADALSDRDRWAVATDPAEVPRVTLTYPVLNNTRTVLFLVTEADRAGTVREVLEEPHVPRQLPAQGISPSEGDLFWYLTDESTAELTSAT